MEEQKPYEFLPADSPLCLPGINIIKGIVPCSWRGLIYGVPGIGKSTLCNYAPNPVFLDCEDGISRIDCHKTDLIQDYDTLIVYLRWFFKSEYQTVVIDTIDGVETMINKHVCALNSWSSIATPPFGKGYDAAQKQWLELLDIVDKIIRINKNVLFVGHDTIKSHNAPDSDAYDRYKLKLNQKIADTIFGRMDFVFFAQYEALVKDDKTKDERVRAIGTGRRVLRTQECPSWIAKNRFGLEPTLTMDAKVFDKLV